MEEGYYKLQDNNLIFAPQGVRSATYLLLPNEHQNHTYPVDGWYWFTTLQEAADFYGYPVEAFQEGSEMTQEEIDIYRAQRAAIDVTKQFLLAGELSAEDMEKLMLFYPIFEVGKAYKINDVFQYESKLYRVEQAHTSQEDWKPNELPALYTEIAPPGTIPEWKQPTGAQDAYKKGDKVTYNGKTWESLYDANVWAPGVYGWVEI
jgi:hypothetical protein